MIQPRSIVKITDNCGAKIGRIFKVLGSSKKRYAEIGDLVILSVQKAEPRKAIKKKDVLQAVVVRQVKAYRRKDGSYIRFDDNSGVVINNAKEPVGTRIFGPVARELRAKKFMKIISLAPEVL